MTVATASKPTVDARIGVPSPRFQAALDAARDAAPTATPVAAAPAADPTLYVGTHAAPTPNEASADAYRVAASTGTTATQAVSGGGPAAAIEATPASGAWNSSWEQVFKTLALAPVDIAYLRSAGYDAATLDDIAMQLQAMDPVGGQVAPVETPTQVPNVQPVPTQVGGWSAAWAERFGEVLTRMGVPSADITQQLQDLSTRDLTEADLSSAYDGMQRAVGDFDPGWSQKFTQLMTKLEVPEEQRTQALQQLAQAGMSTAKLQETYDAMAASLPGWDDDWQKQFEGLGVPKELLEQVKQAGGSDAQLQQQYDALVKTRDSYQADGRLTRLEEADATDAEKWGVMTQGISGKEFDKVVDQVHSSHVPAWKRILSIGINLIPGAFAVQYLVGKDLLTGDKIDRTNPLNIIGAVGSGFAAFSAIRGAIAGVQGLVALNSAAQATKVVAGGASLAEAMTAAGTAGKLSQGAFQAIEGAGLLSKFDAGLKVLDYVKAATPLVNKFGEAGRLASVGRGYTQAMQLAAGSAALRTAADGSVVIDKAIKANVLSSLKQGNSITDALAGVQRSAAGADPLLRTADIAKSFNQNGFVQAGGSWKFNPFKRDATVTVGATNAKTGARVIELGRGVDFGTRGGLAQGIGSVKAANIANAPVALQAGAIRASGIGADAVEHFGLQDAMVAKWADKLGVTDGSPFRTLAQLGGSNRAAAQTARAVANDGNQAYAVASRLAQVPGNSRIILPGLMMGAATGSAGMQVQPGWDVIKADPGILVGRSKDKAANEQARMEAEQEQARMAADYAARQRGETPGTPPFGSQPQRPAGVSGSELPRTDTVGPTPGVDAGSTTGNGAYTVDPETGYIVDAATGLMADPNTGAVYDPKTGRQVAQLEATG